MGRDWVDTDLVREAIEKVRDDTVWAFAVAQEREHKRLLGITSEKWDAITGFKVFKKPEEDGEPSE